MMNQGGSSCRLLAACVGTLALVQAELAQAQSTVINTSQAPIKHPAEPGVAKHTTKLPSKTANHGNPNPANISDQASAGSLSSYKNNQKPKGPGTVEQPISDQASSEAFKKKN
jgi:hypothetical protein